MSNSLPVAQPTWDTGSENRVSQLTRVSESYGEDERTNSDELTLVDRDSGSYVRREANSDSDGSEVDVMVETRLSPEAAYGAAHARIVAVLEQNGAPAPHALASEILNGLTKDGWKRAPRDLPPPRPKHGAPPGESYRDYRKRLAAETAALNAEIAKREGRAS